MYKCSIIGHFGERHDLVNGQTVKTKNLHRALVEHMGAERIDTVDTYGFKKHIFPFFAKCFSAIKNSENVIVLPAHNGVKVLLPFFAFLNVFFKRKLHYAVIGGWLPEFLDAHKWLKAFAKQFDGIYVETSAMKKGLEQRGFKNAVVMPNFKFMTPLTEEELVYPTGEPYKLCTFSRVMKEKGIADAVEAVKIVNEQAGRTVYTLDIYGQVDENQIEWFDDLQKQFPEYVKYKGVVPSEESVQTLKDYFALLFPTHFYTEGIPGTILDAYAAGVPVIVALWVNHADVFIDGITGYGYPFEDFDAFAALLKKTYNDPRWINMKTNVLQEAENYQPERAIQNLKLV